MDTKKRSKIMDKCIKCLYTTKIGEWVELNDKKDKWKCPKCGELNDYPHKKQEGLKYDDGKLLMSLVEPEYIEDVARVLTFGAEKYRPNSWQTVEYAERRYKDALLRHTMAYLKGESVDPESGLTHLSHMATNVMFLSHFERKEKDVK